MRIAIATLVAKLKYTSIAIGLALAPELAFAQVSSAVATQSSPSVGVAAGSSIQSADLLSWILSTGLVLLSIFILAWLVKKSRFSPGSNQQIQVIASTAIGTRERLCVVSVADQQYLLAVTAQNISLIDKLEPGLEPRQHSGKNVGLDFASLLKLNSKSKQNPAE
ncbi:flagellar biosynthetic protein FliO [Alginatibacterium sediminis]|uniref:Flagellar protein n=1 Tax=Alginatibacterium sediminis TaxID=2164068 RepID=A0A420EFL3_9ALTE|nr:flagellar biosynthetic protein FliO [Alginatibacterium sediminis]RKF19489.1 flagellar biosynthetic protein FliO [Alginatibacterium sediminis]